MARTLWLDLDGVVVQVADNLKQYEDKDVFKNLPMMVGSKTFVARLQKLAKIKNVELKVISKAFFKEGLEITENQKKDKVKVAKSLGFSEKNIVVLGSDIDKNIYCKPMDVLIDDYGQNIKSWQNAFGIGVQAFEKKIKDGWITARSYNQILQKIDILL